MGASARGCAGVEAGPALQRAKKGQGGGKHRPWQKGRKKIYSKNDKDDVFLLQITRLVFNRLGVAGAVLQTPL